MSTRENHPTREKARRRSMQIQSHSRPQSHLAYFVTDEWPFTLTVFNHIVQQVKFSTKLAINLNSISTFSFSNDLRRSNFRTVPCELAKFKTGQRFLRYSENASYVEMVQPIRTAYKRQFPPVLFSCLRFLDSGEPTISEPGKGY